MKSDANQLLKDEVVKTLLTTLLNLEFQPSPLYKTVLVELILNSKSVKEIAEITKLTPNRTKAVIKQAEKLLLNHILLLSKILPAYSLTQQAVSNYKGQLEHFQKQLGKNKNISKEIIRELNQQIAQTGLSSRLKNNLRYADIYTVGEAINIGRRGFSMLRNSGKKTIQEFEDYMEQNGLSWDMRFESSN
jgi:hypothetical protein